MPKKIDEKILESIETNDSKFERLYLSDVISSEDLSMLFEALRKNCVLKFVSLENLELKDEDIRQLAEILRSNSSLKELHLGSNKFGNLGLTYLAEMLVMNSCLTKIYLQNNDIDNQGALIFSDAIEKSKRIIQCNLSNKKISYENIDRIDMLCGVNECSNAVNRLKLNDPEFTDLHLYRLCTQTSWRCVIY